MIKTGPDQYWGFPAGNLSYRQWEQELIEEFNIDLPEGYEPITSIPGFQGTRASPLIVVDTAKIAMDVFEWRKSKFKASP